MRLRNAKGANVRNAHGQMASIEGRIRELEKVVWWLRFWVGMGLIVAVLTGAALFLRVKGMA